MNHDELVSWSTRAVWLLRDLCAEAQAAAGNPQGEDQCQDIRALLAEYERIEQGLPAWQARVNDQLEQPDLWDNL